MARDLMVYFRAEAREILHKLSGDTLSFERSPSADLMARMLRHAHTLKGAARVVAQKEIATALHQFEEVLSAYRGDLSNFPREQIDQLLACLDQVTHLVAALEKSAPPEAVEQPAPNSGAAPQAQTLDDPGLGLGLLSYQGVEVDALLEDLRAATGQIEALRRNLQGVERGKTLGELLLAQLSGDGAPKGARFVAEELQSQLRGVERNLAFGVDQIERELRQVQESTEKLRLLRAEALFPILRRILRDAVSEQGFQAELLTKGGELRLDAQLLASVQGALVQMLRNSVAHGIEPPAERQRMGKPARATVSVEVARQGRFVVFRCRDDGRGIDLQAVRRGLDSKGVAVKGLNDEGVLQALMQGGVSTAATVTQAAGRGIGLDLIRETASSLGGKVSLSTEPGRFTLVTLCLPWAVAGMDFLELSVPSPGAHEGGSGSVLIPLECVQAALRLQPGDVSREADGETIVHEGQGIRLLSLNSLMAASDRAGLAAVVVKTSEGRMALSADSLRGARVASLLPLPPWTQAAPFVAGAALDADGDAQLVLDPDGLFQESLRARPTGNFATTRAAKLLVIDDSLTTRMLQQSILESAGFEVELACSAEEGLQKALEAPYGLFLVDVEMPGIDGFTFVERIRSDPQLRDIPAILVTSRDSAEDKLRGQSVGAQGYMVKSEFDQKDLLRQIRSLLA